MVEVECRDDSILDAVIEADNGPPRLIKSPSPSHRKQIILEVQKIKTLNSHQLSTFESVRVSGCEISDL